jgi:hypothetical protein
MGAGRGAVAGARFWAVYSLAQHSATETERMLGYAERPSSLRTPAGDSGRAVERVGAASRTAANGEGNGRRLNERQRERGQRKVEECNNVR